MDSTRINVVLYVSFIVFVLDKYSECTTHPRVKMYGPKVTVIDRRKPETKIGPNIDDETNAVPRPADVYSDEPSCLELRVMWRTSQRRNQLAQSANRLSMAFDPFAFSAWDDYVKPRYTNRQNPMMFERTMPADRFRFYRQLGPFEKIARLTSTAARAVMDDRELSRKANLFRLGYPGTKIPVQISMRLTTKDRFQELKEMVRHEKAKDYRRRTAADNGEDGTTFAVVPIAAAAASTSNDTGKKRPPGYESLMSRPRHFSQGHYMNVKPNGERNVVDGDGDDHDGGGGGDDDDNGNDDDDDDDDDDGGLTAMVSAQYKSSPLANPWNSRS